MTIGSGDYVIIYHSRVHRQCWFWRDDEANPGTNNVNCATTFITYDTALKAIGSVKARPAWIVQVKRGFDAPWEAPEMTFTEEVQK